MKEIGGYLELDPGGGNTPLSNGVLLNSGRREMRRYSPGEVSSKEIRVFLDAVHDDYHAGEPCDYDPIPYSEKLARFADCFFAVDRESVSVFQGGVLGYCNDMENRIAYISFIGRLKSAGAGLGSQLIRRFINLARERGMNRIRLEVAKSNDRARGFYDKFGFKSIEDRGVKLLMEKYL